MSENIFYLVKTGPFALQTGTTGTFDLNTWDPNAEDDGERKPWEGVLAVVGHPTSDKRLLIPNEIGERDMPLPFLVAPENLGGHGGATIAGRIEKITHIPIGDFDRADEFHIGKGITEGAVVVWAEGTLDSSEDAEEAARMLRNGAGVSVDLPPDRIAPFDSETLEELDPRTIDFDDLMDGKILTGIAGKIAAATIVSIAAFEEATVMLVDDHVLVASAYGIKLTEQAALTASAAGLAPLKPPRAFFERREPDVPTPLTVTDKGEVYGHLALWNQCHASFASCERPPRSASDYAYFHAGQIETDSGELLNVGRITVGPGGNARGGHASLVLGKKGAMEHYESTGCVAAFVRATNGKHGIWLSGAVRSDAPAERIRDLRANPPSGDWRDYELVAVLSVPVPGFPIPRAEARLVASGAEEEVAALVASGYVPGADEAIEDRQRVDIVTYRQRMRELAERREAARSDVA